MTRELLFSVTKKDLVIERFRAGGKGGQNQNVRDTGVRIKHPASGAVGESRNHRTQHQNQKEAFLRMANSDAFKMWWKREAARHAQNKDLVERQVQREVAELMRPENLLVEVGINGDWIPE